MSKEAEEKKLEVSRLKKEVSRIFADDFVWLNLKSVF